MYFTKIELHNFGIYKGHHEMCLSDQIGNRNVTLIGGLNGRGKTTFLDAILLALYGKQALKYVQENARSYERLLIEHINKHATDDLTYVAVSLGLDDGTYYLYEQDWSEQYNIPDEPFEVVVDATTLFTQDDYTNAAAALTALTGSVGGVEDEGADVTDGIVSGTIENNKGSQLPSTGGIGTTIFYVVGGVLVVGAGVLLVTKKRAKDAE